MSRKPRAGADVSEKLKQKLAKIKATSGDRPVPRPFSDEELREIADRAKRLSEIAKALRMAEAPSDVRRFAQNVASALFRLVEAFNPGGRFGNKPLPELPALLRPRGSNIGILLTRIRWAMQKIGAAVGYNPAVGYATRYPDGRVYGPKIEQVADEHVYAFVQSIRTDELVYGEPGASKDVDDLAAAADELLAKLPTAVDCGAFVFQIEETFTDAPPTMVDTLGILPDVLAPVDDAVTCYTVEVTIQGPAGAIAPEGTLADASDENGKHESTPPGNNVPGGLGWLTIDRESRTVARSGLDKTAEFGKKERAWRLFVAVVEAGENGTTRADLGTALLGESNPNNLDQWKKACNEILLQLNTEVICDQRGLWRLTSF